jgi:hypothetical protein
MWFPKGRHPDSITYSRDRSPDSGFCVVIRQLFGNAIGNTISLGRSDNDGVNVVATALDNLDLLEYSGIREVFGRSPQRRSLG